MNWQCTPKLILIEEMDVGLLIKDRKYLLTSAKSWNTICGRMAT